jgi:hypothetical protein
MAVKGGEVDVVDGGNVGDSCGEDYERHCNGLGFVSLLRARPSNRQRKKESKMVLRENKYIPASTICIPAYGSMFSSPFRVSVMTLTESRPNAGWGSARRSVGRPILTGDGN